MQIDILPLLKSDLIEFKADMRQAFQLSAEKQFGKLEKQVLPEKDIEKSLSAKGAAAYKAVENGRMVGGAIVVIDEQTQINHLDFLYVKHGEQSKGIGVAIWRELERLYHETREWQTVTPYFEKRNIHFYINLCGFSAVEFFNPKHRDESIPEDMVGGDYFFKFSKKYGK